jgi:hypothetical protein
VGQGIADRVAASREPLIVDDLATIAARSAQTVSRSQPVERLWLEKAEVLAFLDDFAISLNNNQAE